MPPCYRTRPLSAGKAFGDNRRLRFVAPIPPTTRRGENLEAMYTAGARFISWHCHSANARYPIRARRLGAALSPRKVGLLRRLRTMHGLEVAYIDVRGLPLHIAGLVGSARQREIDRHDRIPLAKQRALPIAGIFVHDGLWPCDPPTDNPAF